MVEEYGFSRIAVTAPTHSQLSRKNIPLPQGIFSTPKPLLSKRRPIHGQRNYGNLTLIDARWPKDHLHSSRSPILEFVINGSVVMPFGDYQLHCQAGHGVLSPPGVAYSDGTHLLLDESAPHNLACDLLKMRPYSTGLQCWLSHTRDGKHYVHREANESCRITNYLATVYLEALTEEMQREKSGCEKIANGLLVALVNLVIREVRDNPQFSSVSAEQKLLQQSLANNPNPMAIAQDYINNHLGESPSIESVARHVYMSERSFTTHFRKETGMSFMQFLTQCRMEKAQDLLANTDWPIEQVATFVGLKPGRFRELFRETTGLSPTEFRVQRMAEKQS